MVKALLPFGLGRWFPSLWTFTAGTAIKSVGEPMPRGADPMLSQRVRSTMRRTVDRFTRRVLGPSLDKVMAQRVAPADSAAATSALEQKLTAVIEQRMTPVDQKIATAVDQITRPAFERYDQLLAPERILESPYLTAKRLNPLEARTGYCITPNRHPPDTEDLPVPPRDLWEGYGLNEQEHLASGREHVASMQSVLARSGADLHKLSRIMDFGCAAGRMIRALPRDLELWGCDIKADSIDWCQQNLPFNFVPITTFPHLPFEDDYFDLVYAGSVFTHIIDQPDAWFLELRRIVRKGGYLFITIMDKHTLELATTTYADRKDLAWFLEMLHRFDDSTQVLSQDFGCFSFEGGKWGGYPVPQVFYDADYLIRKWSRWAQPLSKTEEAYGWQTALLFQK